MAEKNKLSAIINGKEYALVSEQSIQHMQSVALCVDEKMKEISSADSSKHCSTTMLAVLTALNIADDYITTKQNLDKTIEDLINKEEELKKYEPKIKQFENKIKENDAAIDSLQKKLIKIQSFLDAKGINYIEK